MNEVFQAVVDIEAGQDFRKQITSRIDDYLNNHLRDIWQGRKYSRERVLGAWEMRDWSSGKSEVKVFGVLHVPETLLDKRQ